MMQGNRFSLQHVTKAADKITSKVMQYDLLDLPVTLRQHRTTLQVVSYARSFLNKHFLSVLSNAQIFTERFSTNTLRELILSITVKF